MNKVKTFKAKNVSHETFTKPKKERKHYIKKWFKKLRDLLGRKYLVSYVVYTGSHYIPFKDIVTTTQLNEMMVSPQLFIYSVVSKSYLSTIHNKVVDSDEKINAHTDISEQLYNTNKYDNM